MNGQGTIVGASFFIFLIFGFIFLIYLSSRSSPLFKMRCKDCGGKDKNWEAVDMGYDDFAWQHKCSTEPKISDCGGEDF